MAIDKKVLIELIGKDKTAQAFRGINAGLKDIKAGLAKMRNFAIGGAAAVGALAHKAIPFEQRMLEIGTLVDRNKVNLGLMGKEVLKISSATATGPADLQAGLYDLLSAGFSATKVIGVLAKTAKTAKVGVGSTAETVNLLTTTLDAFKLNASESGNALDVFMKTVQLGKTNLGQLNQSIGQVASIWKSGGGTYQELFAGVASLTKAGVQSSAAMTQLRGIMSAVIKPSKDAAAAAKELGLDFSVAGIQSKGFAAWLDEIKEATGGNSEELARLFPNIEGLNAALVLTGGQSENFKKTLEELKGAAGTVSTAFGEMSKDEAFKLQQSFQQLSNYGIQLGSAIIPVVVDIVKWFKEWYAENPELVSSLGKLTAAAVIFHQSGLLAISGGVVKLIAQIPSMVAAIQAWTVAQGGLAVAVNATIAPAALFLAEILAIGAAAYGIYKAVAWLNEASGLADYLGDKLNTVGQWLGVSPEEMSQADLRKRMLTNAGSPEERAKREAAFAEHDVNMDIANDRYRKEGRDLGASMRAAADAATQDMKAGIDEGLRERDNGQLAGAEAVGY